MHLKQNYHMHTYRCGHAVGEDRQYVEAAIAAGYETVGFSDHTPFPVGFPRNEHVRMPFEWLEGYVTSVLDLRKEYRNDIRLLLALEVEYFPQWHERWLRMVEPYPFDYFIMGQHNVGADETEIFSSRPMTDAAILKAYVDQCIEGLQTGTYLYLAHPDLIHYTDLASPVYQSEMRRLCTFAKEHRIPLEINLLGLSRERHYPCDAFWKIAGEVGNTVVIGADAHDPESVLPLDALHKAEQIIQNFNLKHEQNLL